MGGVPVAEDHELAGVFHHLIAPAVDFGKEAIFACEPFDVACLAANDAALLDGFRREEVLQLGVWGKGRITALHLGRVVSGGLRDG